MLRNWAGKIGGFGPETDSREVTRESSALLRFLSRIDIYKSPWGRFDPLESIFIDIFCDSFRELPDSRIYTTEAEIFQIPRSLHSRSEDRHFSNNRMNHRAGSLPG